MKRTTKYELGYFEEGDVTTGAAEMQRWETLDAQLYSLFSILGNGIITGWNMIPADGLSVVIAPGTAHVNFVAVQSTVNTTLSSLTPNTRNYIYAALATDSYWNQTVNFLAYVSNAQLSEYLYIGYVDTDATSVTDVNIDNRVNLGFVNIISTLVSDHRHIGGEGNPAPINLATDVQGVLNQNSLPDTDASLIKTGKIAEARLPLIDHITHLVNQGTLTHAQLDSFVQALSITGSTLMGETSTIDLLQLILALKHIYPDIDKYLINELAYVPGISPNTLVDWDNTTAVVDTRSYSEGGDHTITGLPSPGQKNYTYTWDSEAEFSSGTLENVVINGDYVDLNAQENKLVIDEFTDLSKWQVITDDMSSLSIALSADSSTYIEPPASAKLVVGSSAVEIALIIKKEFDAQDWSGYKKFVFFLKTESVQHGDIYFYLNDNFAGTQNSHTKILDRNEPTVNIDTLQNGWQEITVDISSYIRTNINTIGFYISSQKGWDTSKGFDLNLDNIYLTTGQEYYPNGYLRVIFGGNFLYDFWRLRWDAQLPTDSESTGLSLKGRTRVGNTLADLQQSMWSAYMTVSGSEITLPTNSFYKYIEIEMYFDASTNLNRTPSLRSIYLDFYASDIDNSFNYETKDDWDSGTKINIDTNTVPNSMMIYGTADIGNFIYGADNVVSIRDKDLNELYRITSSMLPQSTYQILNNIPPSLGLVTGVSRGNNGGIWFCDTDNDRAIETDRAGGLIRGFFGSYLVENQPIESNVSSTTTTTTIANSTAAVENLAILQTVYNSEKGILYIIFNRDTTLTELAGLSDKFIKVGTNHFYLDDAVAAVLAGFDHVYQITITGANLTVFNQMVNNLAPSILILSPYEQQRLSSNSATVKFLTYNFEMGTSSGENGIRVTLDGTNIQDIYSTSVSFSGLTSGRHTIKAQLLNGDGSLNTNIEAIAESTFIVYLGTYSLPYVSVQSPKPNQISSTSPVQIEFNIENFPILSTGQHLRYSVDGNAPVDYYSEAPILVEELSAGLHNFTLYLVDKRGNNLGYTYGSATVKFIIGLNSRARPKFYCTFNSAFITSDVIVANLIFTDVYAPFDIQYIPSEVSSINPNGKESVLIGKLTNNYVLSKVGG